jgi:hypothetical protein
MLCTVVICAVVLALSSPVGWGWSLTSLSEFWFYGVLLIGLVLIGFIAPAPKFSGPLRFGYLESNTLLSAFFLHLPGLWLYAVLAFFLLSSSRYWMICAFPVSWQYVLQQYWENVQDIRNKVDVAQSLATVAANSAREHVKEAAEYEKQVMEVVVVRRRDAMLAESVKITDFFDRATVSWAALGKTAAAAIDTTIAAKKVEKYATAAAAAAGVAGAVAAVAAASAGAGAAAGAAVVLGTAEVAAAAALYESAKSAVTAAEDAEKEAKSAQITVSQSQTARQQVAVARQKALDNAKKAAEAADSLKDRMEKSSDTLFKAVDQAENARRFADQAIAAAVEGDKTTALSLAENAGSAAAEVVKAMEELLSAKKDAHKVWFDLV